MDQATGLASPNGRGQDSESGSGWSRGRKGSGKKVELSYHFAGYQSCHLGICTTSLLVCKYVPRTLPGVPVRMWKQGLLSHLLHGDPEAQREAQ